MKNEDLIAVAQLLAAIKETVEKLATAERNKEVDMLNSAKKEILTFQRQIQDLL
jgi:hypothetical protein